MDEETSKFMANTKDVDVMKYSDMKLYIETRYLEELGRKVINPEKKTGPVSGLEESEQDPWLDYSYGNDLDALKGGKKGWGKGNKGGGTGPQCYRCNGHGHLARDCPTPEGSDAPHICAGCGGRGHFARDHPEQPKGKGKGAETWKGKGKTGKDGYKGYPSPYKGFGGNKGYSTKGYGKYGKGKGKDHGGEAVHELRGRRRLRHHEG